jgi:hypothetical protein
MKRTVERSVKYEDFCSDLRDGSMSWMGPAIFDMAETISHVGLNDASCQVLFDTDESLRFLIRKLV